MQNQRASQPGDDPTFDSDPEGIEAAPGLPRRHGQTGGLAGRFAGTFHRHAPDGGFDERLDASRLGVRALWWSLGVLAVTAAIQLGIALRSGSVGLLADTIHNFSDALTALPLWLAFVVGRWPPNRRYTYGYGRAEDVAGLAVVVVVVASAVLVVWESYQRIVRPVALHQLRWVMVAAVVGCLGNEAVALIRSRVGRHIGSAALEADGAHARVDGLTSLGVLVGAVAVALGFPIADPIAGLLISVPILLVSKEAALAIWHRLMDAVDPELARRAEGVALGTPGVLGVNQLRLRWVGHRLIADLRVVVDERASLQQALSIATDLRHRLVQALPRLSDVSVQLEQGVSPVPSPAAHRGR